MGESIELNCTVGGSGPIWVKWTKDGKDLTKENARESVYREKSIMKSKEFVCEGASKREVIYQTVLVHVKG